MEAESMTKKYTHETPYTTQQQFQYFKASPSQLRSKLFTAVIFSCSSQIHSSLEGQQGASEIRYQTYREKQSTPPPYSTLPPSPYMLCLTHPTLMHTTLCSLCLAWGFVHFFFFFLITKDFKQHFTQQERIPTPKLMYCSIS